jgi:hypothetical protein
MAVLGCSEEDKDETSDYDGTWVKDGYSITISGSNLSSDFGSGKISFSGTTATVTTTEGETMTFTMVVSEDKATISGLTGEQAFLNGVWTRK